MQKRKLSIQEMEDLMIYMNKRYYFFDLWNARESFLALKSDEYSVSLAGYGVYILKIMQGKLEEAKIVLDNINLPYPTFYLELIYPPLPDAKFIETIEYMRSKGYTMRGQLSLTTGRPSVLNGFRDFSSLDSYLETEKEKSLQYLYVLYDKSADSIYRLALAERYYQQNRNLEAMKLVGQEIPALEQAKDYRCLFVALAIQLKLLITSGETASASNIYEELKQRLSENNNEIIYNIDALGVIIAIYEGNYELVSKWLESDAPDEHKDFNMLDLYRYMVKLRCYLLTGKIIPIVALSEKLRPLLEKGNRYTDLCEVDLLLAMSFYLNGDEEHAFEALKRALRIAKTRNFQRLVGDEGGIILKLLQLFKNKYPDSEFIDFIDAVIEIARKILVIYPDYLILPYKKEISFTDIEISILTLLGQGKSYDMISDYLSISINTVRYHVKKIYAKLNAKSSSEAIYNAKKLGVI